MGMVAGSQHNVSHMRQLAQAEVDWTYFRSAIELYHIPGSGRQGQSANAAGDSASAAAEASDNVSLPACSPTADSAECSPRSGCQQSSPHMPRVQQRPYTAPTVVSRQPLHSGTDCPCYVSSLYKGQKQADLHLRYQIHADASHSMHSMTEEISAWSSPQPCSPEPYLMCGSGGLALTIGSRERDRPHTSPGVITADPKKASTTSKSKSSKLINAMREGSHVADDPKPLSHIVARSRAWPASSDGHPTGSGLTVRQQACFLGKPSIAKHEQKLAERCGPWQQDLRTCVSCFRPDAQQLGLQAEQCMASADDAMAHRICTTGPV